MKKISSTIIAVICFLSPSFAQVKFGVKTGLNFSNAKDIGPGNNTTLVASNGGLLAEIKLGEKFIARPELLYSIKGCKFEATQLNSKGTLSLKYISIPLLGGYAVADKLTVLLGPELNFLTNANSNFDDADHDLSKGFNKFGLAIDLGLAYSIVNGLGIEVRYCHGFKGIDNVINTDANGNLIGEEKRGSNRVFQLGIFYTFN